MGWTRPDEHAEKALLSSTRRYWLDAYGWCPVGLNPSDLRIVRVRIPPQARGPGDDKAGEWSSWYAWAVLVADDRYDTYLAELREEDLL